ncbi:unnamed protein product [Mucor hiemalis]
MQQPALQDLPPTPSSSALSFLVADQRSIDEEDSQTITTTTSDRLPLNNTVYTTPLQTTTDYGSLSTDFTYSRASSPLVSSSAASTISPNDDDEGLYLLWTHQLLRERGYKPSSCNANEDDDNESVDSSISNLSVDQERMATTSSHHYAQKSSPSSKKPSRNNTSSWLSSCFPMC